MLWETNVGITVMLHLELHVYCYIAYALESTEAKAELSFVERIEANWIDSLRLLNLRNRTAFWFS